MPLFVGVVVLYDNRAEPVRHDGATGTGTHGHRAARHGTGTALETPVQVATVIVLMILGWAIARDVGRGLGPALFRRLDPATAGTVGFLIRLVDGRGGAARGAARGGHRGAARWRLGGAFTAVIFGLAAQQTLGNLIAGTVLLSARPFRVGERVRLQGGPLAGQIEGTVSSLGLLYTTFATGDDSIMVPNSVVLNVAVLPLREPEAVNLRARLRAGMTPGDLQEILEKSLQTPLRDAPRITLEELDGEEVVVRIAATPRVAARVVNWRANCWASSRARRARARARRSAGTGGSRCCSTPSSSSSTGGSSSAPARIRSASPPRLAAGEHAARATGTARRAGRPRAAASPDAARPRTARVRTSKRSRSSRSAAAQVEHARRVRCARSRRWPRLGGQARRRGGQDHDARGGLAQQRDVVVEREAPGDDARERLLAEPALEAQRAARGVRG